MKYKFLGIDVDILDTNEAIEICKDFFSSDKGKTLFFLNAHCVSVGKMDERYLNALQNCDLLLNDGIGVKIGLKVFGIDEKENMNGTDFIPYVIELAEKMDKNIYILGGKPGVAERAAVEVKGRYPNANVVGWKHGYFKDEENEVIVKDIIDKKTDLLIVGMGVPRQEIWIHENKEALSSVKISIAGGAIVDYISGNAKRAPEVMRIMRLEWLHRLVLDPKRLWKRNFVSNMKFLYYVLQGKLSQK